MAYAKLTTIPSLFSLALLCGCPSDDVPPVGETSTGEDSTSTTTPVTVTLTNPSTDDTTTNDTTTTNPTTGLDSTSSGGETSTEGSSSGSEGSESSTTGEPACVDEDLGNTVPQMVMGDNSGGGDDLAPSCAAGGGGEDYIYAFTAPEDGWYRFDTVGSAYDTSLGVFEDCAGAQLRCNDDAEGGTDSVVEMELTMGQSVVVAVDSNAGDVGAFNLNIGQLTFMDPPVAYCDPMGMQLAECMMAGGGTNPAVGTLLCDDVGADYFFDIFEIPVAADDCVFVVADNIDPEVGATGLDAGDPWIIVQDEMGNGFFLDDEVPCTDPTWTGDFGCPSGGGTAVADGMITVGIGQYGGMGCPNPSVYTLSVSINGVDVDLSAMAPLYNDGLVVCP